MDGKFVRDALKWETVLYEGIWMVRCTFPDGKSRWGTLDGADTECDILRALIDDHRAKHGEVVPLNRG